MIVNFIKKIFSYFIKFILVFFPKKETTKIKPLNNVKEKKRKSLKKIKKLLPQFQILEVKRQCLFLILEKTKKKNYIII